MGLFNTLTAVAKKKLDTTKERLTKGKREAIDTSLPLQIHIGSRIALDQTPFLIHGTAITQAPPAPECLVFAYGQISLGEALVHRFYLESCTNPEEKSVLQMVEGDGIEECRLFAALDEVYPESPEDWEFWIGDEEGYIGLPQFEDKKGHSYDRVWGDEPGRIVPAELNETLYLDSFGDKKATVDHASMLYGRWIDEEAEMAEYILISREAHTDDSALIQISTGIDIFPESITVKY